MTASDFIAGRARALADQLAATGHAHWRGIVVLLAAVAAPLALVGEIAREVFLDDGYSWDEPVLEVARSVHHPALDAVMLAITTAGSAWVLVPASLLVLGWLLRVNRLRAASFFVLSAGGAAIVNIVAKLAFQRDRPTLWDVIAPAPGYSFPSGHAMGAMAFAGAFVLVAWPRRHRWRMLGVGLAFALLVGLSRVYLGVHYLTDVVAGWLASLAWVAGVYLLFAWRGTLQPLWSHGVEHPAPASPDDVLDDRRHDDARDAMPGRQG